MCAGGATASNGSSRLAADPDEELKWMKEQNARLLQQQHAQEIELKKLRSELTQHNEEEIAQRIARHAKETAACVLRHEDELRRVTARYEEQLADRQPQLGASGRMAMSPPASRSSSTGALHSRREAGGSGRGWNPRPAESPGDSGRSWNSRRADTAGEVSPGFDAWSSVDAQRLEEAVAAQASAQAQLRSAEADAAKYKKRAQKLKTSRVEEKIVWRNRLYGSAVVLLTRDERHETKMLFLLWRGVAKGEAEKRQCVDSAEDEWITSELGARLKESRSLPQRRCLELLFSEGFLRPMAIGPAAHLMSVATARPLMTLTRAMRAWADVRSAARNEMKLRSFADTASAQASEALATLRSESRLIAVQRVQVATQAAEANAMLFLTAYFATWARHCQATRLGAASSSPSVGLGSRGVARAIHAALELACAAERNPVVVAMFHAWHHEMARNRWSRQGRRGDVVLNSGEAARRTKLELDETRSKAAEELSRSSMEVASATKRVAAAQAQCTRVELLVAKEHCSAILHIVVNSWASAAKDALHQTAAAKLQEAVSQQTQSIEKRQQTALACARNESTAALHQAWDQAAEASRKAAALERRERQLVEELESRPPTAAGTRCPSRAGLRPTTATLVQVQQQLAVEEANLNSISEDQPEHPAVASNAVAEVWTLPEHSDVRDKMRCLLESVVGRHEQDWQARPFEAWRRIARENQRKQELIRIQADALEQVFAARDGRKGLFIAAIGQQVRQWQANAFTTWRCYALKASRERLATSAKAGSASTPIDFGAQRATADDFTFSPGSMGPQWPDSTSSIGRAE